MTVAPRYEGYHGAIGRPPSEVRRALGILEALGIIGSLQVNGRDEFGQQLTDETGRSVFELSWSDLATGSPVEDVYRPLGG